MALISPGEIGAFALAKTFSFTGVASTPAVILTGTWFTGGSATTTKPQLLIEPTGTTSTGWSTSGTGLGVNAASGFTGRLLDLQIAGSSKLSVSGVGVATVTATDASGWAATFTNTSATNALVNLAHGGGYGLVVRNDSANVNTYLLDVFNNGVGDGLLYVRGNGMVGIGTTAPLARLHVPVAPTATANYGLLSLGSGFWDGSTAGFFVGSASGTGLAINAASGFAGNLVDVQVAGVSKFKVGATGLTTITAGTLTDQAQAFVLTATQPSSIAAAQYAQLVTVTSAGTSNQVNGIIKYTYAAGYTGSTSTFGMFFDNQAAGTGANLVQLVGNVAVLGQATATTTGTNYGLAGYAQGGNRSVAVAGLANVAKNNAANVGVLGIALNTGSTPTQVGGYFGLHTADPTLASAALMADNGATTSDILVARDNGTAVFTIADGGSATFARRALTAQGADVVAANDLTLGTDGNTFEITGATQINAITTAGWQLGSAVTFLFASNPTVKHNTAGGAGTAVLLLAGAADFSATAGDTLTLRYSDIGGTSAWREIGRAVI